MTTPSTSITDSWNASDGWLIAQCEDALQASGGESNLVDLSKLCMERAPVQMLITRQVIERVLERSGRFELEGETVRLKQT